MEQSHQTNDFLSSLRQRGYNDQTIPNFTARFTDAYNIAMRKADKFPSEEIPFSIKGIPVYDNWKEKTIWDFNFSYFKQDQKMELKEVNIRQGIPSITLGVVKNDIPHIRTYQELFAQTRFSHQEDAKMALERLLYKLEKDQFITPQKKEWYLSYLPDRLVNAASKVNFNISATHKRPNQKDIHITHTFQYKPRETAIDYKLTSLRMGAVQKICNSIEENVIPTTAALITLATDTMRKQGQRENANGLLHDKHEHNQKSQHKKLH